MPLFLEPFPWLFPSVIAFLILLIGLEYWRCHHLYRFRPLPSLSASEKDRTSVSVLLLYELTSTIDTTMYTLKAIAQQQGVEVEVHILAFLPDATLKSEIESYAAQAPYPIRYTLLPQTMKNIAYRKMAITIGTKSARHEAIVLTQSGTIPNTSYWLYNMAKMAKQQDIYAAPAFLAQEHAGSSAIHYLSALLGLATQSLASEQRMATETNLVYSKTAFINNSKVFSKDLDGEGGEALSIARTIDHSTSSKATRDTIVYINQSAFATTLTLQKSLRIIEHKYPAILRHQKLNSILLQAIWIVSLIYTTLRLLLPVSNGFELVVYDTLVGIILLVHLLLHTISYIRLAHSLSLGGSSLLAYWYALWLPIYIYYYKLLYRKSMK